MSRKTSIVIIITLAAFLVMSAAASAAEIQLAGIKLGRSALGVIQKYGDPSDVRVGGRSQAADQAAGPFGMEMPPAGLSGVSMEAPPPGMGADFGAMPGGAPSFGPNVGQQPSGNRREVNWIYKFAKNKTLEFILDGEGRVLQIAAYGIEWSGMKTSKGIGLGDTYKEVILTYGFPESHEKVGQYEMVLKYANSDRVAFTLVGNQVVGITIAFMD